MRLLDLSRRDQRAPMLRSARTSNLISSGLGARAAADASRAGSRYRRANPVMRDAADVVQWVWYDLLTTANAATTPALYTFFSQQNGQAGVTLRDTNMGSAQELNAPQRMNVYGISFSFGPDVDKADIDAFYANYVLTFFVTDKPYVQCPVRYFGGPGIHGVSTQTATSVWNNGTPYNGNYFSMCLPQGLPIGTQVKTDGAGQPIMDSYGQPIKETIRASGYDGIRVEQTERFRVEVRATAGFTVATVGSLKLEVALWNILSRAVN